jgi:flavorubredoxin
MRVEIFHASVYGTGARVAGELRRLLMASGNDANVHHIAEIDPADLPSADVYVFGSPTRRGRPIRGMRGFLKRTRLPAGTRYAVFATHGNVERYERTGRMPTLQEQARHLLTLELMDEQLRSKQLVKVADMRVFVHERSGSMEGGWERKVGSFAAKIVLPP